MSNFTPLVTKTYEFDGDSVTVVFSRLKRKHMLKSSPLITELRKARQDDDEDKVLDITNELLNDVIDVMPEYVSNITGLTDSDGNELGVEVLADDSYFLRLATLVALDMVNESAPVDSGNA